MKSKRTDVLRAASEALWLTLRVDLHLPDQPDADLATAAEELGWTIQELRLVWPLSPVTRSSSFDSIWAEIRAEAGAMHEHARTIEKRFTQLEAKSSVSTSADRHSYSTTAWAKAAKRSREPLAEVWSLVAKAFRFRAGDRYPARAIRGYDLPERLAHVRERVPPIFSFSGEPEVQPRALLDRLRDPTSEMLGQHLSERIARRWKVRKPEEVAIEAVREVRDHNRLEVKKQYIQSNLFPVVEVITHPQRIRIGNQWQKRKSTPVRVVSTGPDDAETSKEWAESAITQNNDRSPSRLWPEELPVYRTWKWIVNKTINEARSDLIREWGEGEDSAVETCSLDRSLHNQRPGKEEDEGRLLHEKVPKRGADRHHEALVAQEELEAEIDRACKMLDVGSPQQREIFLAHLDPDLASALDERRDLSQEEKGLAKTECGSWSEVADETAVSSKGQAHRQYRRCEEKLNS